MAEDIEAEKRRFDFLKSEYGLVESKWRFLQGLRYAVFGGVAAALTSLYALYANALVVFQGKPPHGIGRWALFAIPIVALALLEAARLLERRLRELYGRCSQRGATIENIFQNPSGIFNTLLRVGRPIPLDHTVAIRLAAVIISVVWCSLLYLAYTAVEGTGP